MKRLIVLFASLALSIPALASKARVGALQGAFDIVDTQTIFYNPAHMHKLGSLLTFEMGGTGAASNPKAEGGFLMKRDDAKWGFYLGHASAMQNALRATSTTAYPKMDNPVDFFYGQGEWAFDVGVSSSQDDATMSKQTTVTARFGMVMGDSQFSVGLESGQAENSSGATTDKFKGSPVIDAAYQLNSGEWSYEAGVNLADTKVDTSGVTSSVKETGFSLGALHRPMAELYYGVQFNSLVIDVEGAKKTTTALPIFLGIEKDVFSWLAFRGSVKQNFLVGEVKDETVTPATKKTNLNDTTVSLGASVKQANFSLDGLIAGSTSGKIDGNNVLTTGAVTYWF